MEKEKQKTDVYAMKTGDLPFTLMNDYLFKVVFQSNDDDYAILKSLLSSMINRREEEITSVEVTNSIVPGDAVDDKTIMLDIRLIFNGKEKVNIEMQVRKQVQWVPRSLYYLCRNYVSDLKKSENYLNLKPVYHIGILDFDIEGLTPKLYSKYQFADIENGEIYSSNLTISVLNLKRIDIATDEDRAKKLDVWARAFKAKTWEELKEIASNYDIISKVSEKVYYMTEDEKIREMCAEREMRESLERQREREYQELQNENERLKKEVAAGIEEGVLLAIISCVRDGVFSVEIGAQRVGMTLEEFTMAMSEAK